MTGSNRLVVDVVITGRSTDDLGLLRANVTVQVDGPVENIQINAIIADEQDDAKNRLNAVNQAKHMARLFLNYRPEGQD